MPRIPIDTTHNFAVYVYSNDHSPAHVHVFKVRKNHRDQPNMKIAIW